MIVLALISSSQVLTLLLSSLLSFNLSYSEFSFSCPTSPEYHQSSFQHSACLWPKSPHWSPQSPGPSSHYLSVSDSLNASPFSCHLPANYSSPGHYLHFKLCKSCLSYLVFLICAMCCLIGFSSSSYGYSHLSSLLLYCCLQSSLTLLFNTTLWYAMREFVLLKFVSGRYSRITKVSMYLLLWMLQVLICRSSLVCRMVGGSDTAS